MNPNRLTLAFAIPTLEPMKTPGSNDPLAMPPALLAEVQAAADEQHRPVNELVNEAVESYLENRRWLLANRQAIDAKIRKGLDELGRGEGIPEDRLDAYLERLKSQPE